MSNNTPKDKKSKKTDNNKTNSDGSIDIPSEWPGAFGAFDKVKPYIQPIVWTAVGLGLLYVVIYIILDIILSRIAIGDIIVTLAVESIFYGAFIYLILSALKNKEVAIEESIKYGLSKALNMFVVIIICAILEIISLALLVVPFFFVFPRLILAPIFVIYNDDNIGDAVSNSWNLTRGNVGKVYGLIGIQVLLTLLCLTIIGIPFAVYWGIINFGSFGLLSMYVDNKPKIASKPTQNPSAISG